MWSGSAASVVDLNPAGFDITRAWGVSGASQVGHGGGPATGEEIHALLWKGTAASVVDLNPAGFDRSAAMGVSGASQVGYGDGSATGGPTHALSWSGSAASVVDLHPAGFYSSSAQGVSGAGQAGTGQTTGGDLHALSWNGTAASVVDLHTDLVDLGPDFYWSEAWGIADNGTIVGWAADLSGSYAVLWMPIPEPSTAALLALAVPALIRRRKYPRI